MGPAVSESELAYLVIREGSKWTDVFRLVPGESVTIGRAPTNQIVLKDDRCSRAHAGLFIAIFALSDAVRGVVGGLFSGLVFFFGNILIIGLEGLVVSIQAVRLEFYEFFSRFFQPGATGYRPLEAGFK